MASGYSDLSEIKKDDRFYGAQQKPPKINLLDEKPRRESLVEQQLASRIESPIFQQQQVGGRVEVSNDSDIHNKNYQVLGSQQKSFGKFNHNNDNRPTSTALTSNLGSSQSTRIAAQTITPRNTSFTQVTNDPLIAYSELVNDLTEKEAKLRRELAYTNQHLANPWARPPQVREPRREPGPRASREQQRWVKELPTGGGSFSPRPTSRASSTRSTTEADLMEKTEQLLRDVEELEKKPLKTQQILIENGALERRYSNWLSPNGSLNDGANSGGSVHTAIINVSDLEPDNKSPLPFAFDNLSTLGVRGNIASVGAAEPEKPYPPIFPIVKRTPSPRR